MDKEKMEGLLSTFEEKQMLNAWANERVTDEDDMEHSIKVYIGEEAPIESMRDCSVVTASYQVGADHHGFIGVIGKLPDELVEYLRQMVPYLKEGDFEGAYQVIRETSTLPAVCGRVCPQETQCEAKCTLGIKFEPVGIGRLERFAADWHNARAAEEPDRPACAADGAEACPIGADAAGKPLSNGHKVAVVGSGPSGLTCAGDLARLGYKVSIFEALHTAGGVLVYGIPEFRLPKAIVAREVEGLKDLGVDIETNVIIGKTLTIDELFEDMGFEAVFIGSGAGLPSFMRIPGESLKGVYSANEYLTRSNLMKAFREK